MRKCSCYTKQRWVFVSSKFLIVSNSRMQTYGKNSKAQRRPTNCTFALNSIERRILTLLCTILLNQPQTKSVTSVHIHCDCCRRHHCPSRRKAWKGVKAILDGRGCQQGEGKGVARSCRPESRWVSPRHLFII